MVRGYDQVESLRFARLVLPVTAAPTCRLGIDAAKLMYIWAIGRPI